jgi:NADPH:quinone reductase-like Zn-dependent oxidoreductase
MKAVVYDRYGPPDVLRIENVDRPVPKEDEVLVKVRATTVTRADVHTREANRSSGRTMMLLSRLISGVRGPRQRILGREFAGQVEAVGAAVSEFAVGDRVFGLSGLTFGAHAEFMCIRESSRVAHMPAGMSFEEAAPICDGALNALMCLKQADLRKGRTILIYGASGAIGTAGVQLARYFGADVTAVCGTKNLELVRSLGVDRAKRVVFQLPPRQPKKDVLFLKELIEAGKFRPVIDRCYPLEDVIEATRYVETQQKTGNVVLTVSTATGKTNR